MSRYDDDAREMGDSFGFDGGGGRDAATGAAVAQFIDDLRGLGEAEPPPPTAELAAVLRGAPVPRQHRVSAGRKRVVAAVAASLLVGGTGVAAANGRLPQPAQRLVSDVVDNLTPFSVPARSDSDHPSGPGTTAPRERVIVPPAVPAPRHREQPQPRASESEPGGSESDGAAAGGGGGDGNGSGEPSDAASSEAEPGDGGAPAPAQPAPVETTASRTAGGGTGETRDSGGDTGTRDSGGGTRNTGGGTRDTGGGD